MSEMGSRATHTQSTITLFLCGDVMIGRGIDQILPHPCPPQLYEDYVTSAGDYVRLAEQANGPIPAPVDFAYVWGAALAELPRADVRIVNLETSITRSDSYEPKGINYRMSPENAPCLAAAGIDCCVLANNHVIDWGRAGLLDTLAALQALRVKSAGAGRNTSEARAPAVLEAPGKARVLVFAAGSPTSGVPRQWAATADAPGVNVLSDMSAASAAALAEEIARARREGDIIIVSIHWGPNWGYKIAEEQARFARALIDQAGVAIVHGHSSHHPKAIEVYRNRLILYGCGDFLTDYEGIAGYEEFRNDLVLMYFATLDTRRAELLALDLVPLRLRRFQLTRASREEIEWLRQTLDRECQKFSARVRARADGTLALSWRAAARPKSQY